MKRARYTQSAPELRSGALIDVSTHLGNLRYRVWEKMKDIAPFYPVILDPNSTHESLVLSEDLTSFTTSDIDQELPENPERFGKYCEVLGSEGLCSGTHVWEVEVGESENWTVGVAKESVKRKEENVSAPEEGFWTIELSNGKYLASVSKQSVKPLTVRGEIKEVRVTLDWNKRKVTFIDPVNNTYLHTHTPTWTEKLYPYFFSPSKHPLRIKPVKVSVYLG
ncbi:zinc-binding protein A33-like [Chanos chanos]|uniref:Zinc-binding protein A33-like n=1 Tax=Chanos chanos TaxID=29144 RepID=A0A6J2VT49_CHACN|nr:zinc-binding protein A33-like [Chanos chanos]